MLDPGPWTRDLGLSFMILPLWSLWRREMVRFVRQKGRILGALGPPVVFWFLIGSGLGKSFRVPGSTMDTITYLQYFFPGTIILIVMFTAIFATISLIEDRHEGFLQAVLVSPMPRTIFVLGKILGGTTIALVQAMLFLAVAPLAGLSISGTGLMMAVLDLLLLGLGLTGLGFLLAWTLDSTQGFHAVMNLFLIPMWLLSGALFPGGGAPIWLRGIIQMNPLSYGLSALQHSLSVSGTTMSLGGPSLGISLGVVFLFAVVMMSLCVLLVRKKQ